MKTSEITLARFAGEGRMRVRMRCPLTLTHEDVVERGYLLSDSAKIFLILQLLAERYFNGGEIVFVLRKPIKHEVLAR